MRLAASEPIGSGETEVLERQSVEGQAFLIVVEAGDTFAGDFRLGFTNFDLFTAPGSTTLFFPVAAGPSQATIADVDNDGNLDVAVTSTQSDRLNVLLGDGSGLLQAPRDFPIGAHGLLRSDLTGKPADVRARCGDRRFRYRWRFGLCDYEFRVCRYLAVARTG